MKIGTFIISQPNVQKLELREEVLPKYIKVSY